MNKNNTLLAFAIGLFLSGCASYSPKYAKGEPKNNFKYPAHKNITKTFYFIGDAGYSERGEPSPGLLALEQHLDSANTQNDHLVFLGDNIYPAGMPPKDDPDRAQSEYRIDAQLNALKNYEGEILFLPGNHEWYNGGIEGLEREAEYIKEQLIGNEKTWAPLPGCGFEIRELSDEVVLFIMDSQWFLEDWDQHPTINDDCPEMRSRETVIAEIDSELGDYPNSTILFLIHHPLYSNGIHGGQYNFTHHIYPSSKKIPLPILGSMATLIRTAGGISMQDLQNRRYKKMANRLATLANDNQRLVFVSGHEHSLQYIVHGNIHQIISGSGSKNTYATLSNDGLFAYPDQGFVKYDIFEDKSSWASFYGAKNNAPKILYQTEVFSVPEKYPVDSLPDKFPQTVFASIYERENAEKKGLYTSIFGDHYRELYMREIEAKVADLDTLYGGLEVVHAGGGHQSRSIRVKDQEKKEYTFREIEKSALLLLQNSIFKYDNVKEQFKNTLAENMVKDFFTASPPYVFMAIPPLSDAAGVYHTNPEIFYLPKQDNLGRYNQTFGNKLYMIEERPEENWMKSDIWGNPNEDIESTSGLYARMRRDEKYSLDEAAYIRARVFDMLLGDWDRHQDQWRWAEHENEEGNHYFEPIPRDRDQAFSNFDSPFFGTLRGLTGFAKIYGKYGPTIDNVKWFNRSATGLDRTLIKNSGKETWIEQTKYIQEHVTDEIIDEAFSHLPKEIQGEAVQKIIGNLKARRDNLLEIVKRYYAYVAKLAIITATDKDDHIEIERLPEGITKIKVSRIKGGEITDTYIENSYDAKVTKEIWVYALDDDDVIEVHGEGDKQIDIKIIGGQNNDVYKISSGKNIDIYDYKSKPNTYEKTDKANLHITDKHEYNFFNKDKSIFTTNLILPTFGYNPDDGFKIGVQDVFTVNAFKRNPFSSQHKFRGGYYFATQGFDFEYDAQFADIIGNYNLAVGAYFTSPNFTRNFFGYGNETRNPEDERTKDYNRMRISRIGVNVGLAKQGVFGSNFSYMASFQSVQLEDTPNRFLMEEFAPSNSGFYDRKYFAGLDATYFYESYDDVLNPTRGMKFKLSIGGKMNVKKTENTFAYLDPYLSFYNALTRNRKWVLKTNLQSRINIGKGYEFYQAAQLGGDTGLRGYRNERFSGRSSFAAGADIRYGFPQFTTAFLPFQIGVFAGGDVGRVWTHEDNSEVWHNDYGGGIWVNGAEAIGGTFQLFNGEDGLRFSFLLGFKF